MISGMLMTAGSAIAGGFIQSVTGFGSGIVMMLFLPLFLSIQQGSAVSQVVSVPMQLAIIWTYRKSIRMDYLLRPWPFYMAASYLAVRFAGHVDAAGLKLIFGVFLVLLALYFTFVAKQVRLKAGWVSAGVCGTISGIASGLFSISGPPMVLYYMALTGGEKAVYLGTIQAFFLISGLYTTAVRMASGIFTAELVPFLLAGMAGILAGQALGTRFVTRIDGPTMTKLIYAFLGIAGVMTVVSCL